jgi:regulator of replication initiation timing
MSGRQLTRDELEDRLDTMQDAIEDLQTRAELASKKRDRLEEQVWDLQDENEALRNRVAELEGRVQPDPTNKDYAEKSREDKVHEVRVALARQAAQQSGKARYTYRDVIALFGSRPSAGHAYTLLEIAGEADGFRYGEHRGEKALRANTADVNDETVLHAVNNTHESKGGEN